MFELRWLSQIKRETKERLRKILVEFEKCILGPYYFQLSSKLGWKRRLLLLWQFLRIDRKKVSESSRYEIHVLIHGHPGSRMLPPILLRLLEKIQRDRLNIQIYLILQNEEDRRMLNGFSGMGCKIYRDYLPLIEACLAPKGKLLLLCEGQRLYDYCKVDVDAVDRLRNFSVKTMCVQHAGTHSNAVKGLSSAASDVMLLWDRKTHQQLVDNYGVDSARLRIVGNPLHDRLASLDRDAVLRKISTKFPKCSADLYSKKTVLLATTFFYGDKGQDNESIRYLEHVYNSIDFERIFLIVKMHPCDRLQPNLYREQLPKNIVESKDVIMIVPTDPDLDFYALLVAADLVLTRASTAGEEAVALGKPVIAFDLKPEMLAEGYGHLKQYPNYRVIYESPQNALRDAIAEGLLSPKEQRNHLRADGHLEHIRDAHSTERAADQILLGLSS